MNRKRLEQMLNMAEQQARTVMIGQQQSLMPSWVLIDSKNRGYVLGTPWFDDDAKYKARSNIEKFIKKYQIVAYSFVVEAWSAIYPPDIMDRVVSEENKPRNRADRKEIVMALATDGKLKLWRQWKIRRNWDEQVVALELEEITASMEGWIIELLD